MDLETAKQFLADCRELLGFLVSEYGFCQPVLSADESTITVSFFGRTLALECVLDERERWVDFKVALLRDGKTPEEYAVTPEGERVRDHVTQVLLRKGVRGFDFKKVEDSADIRVIWRQLLTNYANLLTTSGQSILREDPSLFGS